MSDDTQLIIHPNSLEKDGFIVAMGYAHEQAHAMSLLSERLLEHPGERAEDLEIFADYALGQIDFAEFRKRLETGEATL